MPEFCTHCKSIAHNVSSFRWLHPKKQDKHNKVFLVDKWKNVELSHKQSRQGWKEKDNPSDIGSSKAFEASHHQQEVHTDHGTEFADRQTEIVEAPVTQHEQPTHYIDAQVESNLCVISIDTSP